MFFFFFLFGCVLAALKVLSSETGRRRACRAQESPFKSLWSPVQLNWLATRATIRCCCNALLLLGKETTSIESRSCRREGKRSHWVPDHRRAPFGCMKDLQLLRKVMFDEEPASLIDTLRSFLSHWARLGLSRRCCDRSSAGISSLNFSIFVSKYLKNGLSYTIVTGVILKTVYWTMLPWNCISLEK